FLFSFITIWIGLNNPLYLPAELMIIAYYSIVSRSTILKNKILFKLTLVYVVPLILVGVLFLMSPLYNQFSQDYINFNRNYYSEFNPNVLSIFGLKILVIDGVKEIITQFSSLNSVFSINGFFLLGWLGAFLYAFVYRNILLNLLLLGLWFSTQLRSVALSIDGEVSNHHTLIWRGLAVYFACALLITATISLLNKYKLISIHKIFIYGVCSLIFLSFLSTIGYALNDNKNLIIGPVNNRQANDDAKLYRKIITNSTNKYSFAGPLKFHYYIGLLGENPSRYYFYLPWHSVCTECTSELNLSFTKNNPSVIYWDDTGTIWSYPTTSWDKTIKEYLANNKYIQSRNNKLQNYYFYSEIDKIKAETLVNGYK
ncbi:MAG: hypothetical protein KC414_12675, partial [Romboutsia sp.]|nr:hypothetical protein [Romboutsia sp.]